MPRELYPYEPERAVIRSFLGGDGALHTRSPSIATSLYITKGALMGDGDQRFLWFDSASAITTVVEGPVHKHIANHVLEQMGVEERITVEVDDLTTPDDKHRHHRVRYFFGGVPADEAPFVLVGPMTLMAWRAENGFKLRRK